MEDSSKDRITRRHKKQVDQVQAMVDHLASQGWPSVGAFVVSRHPVNAMYRHTGFVVRTRQTEWVRELLNREPDPLRLAE